MIADGLNYEIERGKPVPSKNHAIVQGNLLFLLRHQCGKRYRILPEISISINDKERVPDIAVYDPLEFTPGQDEIRLAEIPQGVIEILSPKQNLGDLIAKSSLYFQAGVKSYWLVLPDLTTVYVFSGPNEYEVFVKKGILQDAQLGVELEIEAIFQ